MRRIHAPKLRDESNRARPRYARQNASTRMSSAASRSRTIRRIQRKTSPSNRRKTASKAPWSPCTNRSRRSPSRSSGTGWSTLPYFANPRKVPLVSGLQFERKTRIARDGRCARWPHDAMRTAQSLSLPTTTRAGGPSWRAIARADGQFVYAVRSTGIYCRPSCSEPAAAPRSGGVLRRRRPTRSAPDSARAGAAVRTRPRPDPWVEKIRRACVYLANVDGHRRWHAWRAGSAAARITSSAISSGSSASRRASMRRPAACRRSSAAAQGRAVTTAMLDAGYGSSSRFYERAVRSSACRRRPTGEAAPACTSATRSSPRRSAACWWRRPIAGVCAVAMGTSDDELERALAREYPAADLRRDASGLARWTRQILAHLAGRRPRLDLPLDVRATAFQWQVWKALAAIPSRRDALVRRGRAAIGRPRAARAVARACATNPVALRSRATASCRPRAGRRLPVGRRPEEGAARG